MKPKRQGRVQATAPLTSQWNCKGPCKGCEIDDVRTLACGGSDVPSNLQWQTAENCKAKDKWQPRNATSYQARRMRALFWLVPVVHTVQKHVPVATQWLHDPQKQKACYLFRSRLSIYGMGWLMGLEPTTTGITILDSTN